jgi:hypothetical protein
MSDTIAIPDDNRDVGKATRQNTPQYEPGKDVHFYSGPTHDQVALHAFDREMDDRGLPNSMDYLNYVNHRQPRPGKEYRPGCQTVSEEPGPSY